MQSICFISLESGKYSVLLPDTELHNSRLFLRKELTHRIFIYLISTKYLVVVV